MILAIIAASFTFLALAILRSDMIPVASWTAAGIAVGALFMFGAHRSSIGPMLDSFTSRMEAWKPRCAAFFLLSVGLVIALFGIDIFKGHVLSQPDILYPLFPWRAYAPDDFVRPGNPLLSDIPRQVLPFLVHARNEVLNGSLPLWNNAMASGQPFFAMFLLSIFSPFTAIVYVVPPPQALVVIAMAILLVGGLGMFVFVRSLGLRWPAATFAGIAWLLNPFSVMWVEHYNLASNAAWLPWALWATDRAAIRGGARNAVPLAGAVALILITGHPETAFKCLLLSGSYGLVRLLATERRWRGLGVLTIGYLGGLLLVAVQILPFLEYLSQSRMLVSRDRLPINPMFAPLTTMITAIVPNFLGNPVDGTYITAQNRYGFKANYFDHLIYPGIATWLLAGVGLLWARRDGRARFFFAVAVAATLVMYGTPGIINFLSELPLFKVTQLARFGMVTILGAIVLAAFGIEALSGRIAAGESKTGLHKDDVGVLNDRRSILLGKMPLWLPAASAAVLAIFAIVACLAYAELFFDRRNLVSIRGHSFLAIGLIVGALALIIARLRARLSSALFVLLILALLTLDLLFFGRGFHPLMPPEQVFPVLPEIKAIKQDPDLFRVTGWNWSFLTNTNLAYGLQDFRGYDSIGVARFGELLDAGFEAKFQLAGHGDHIVTRSEAPTLLDLLNVKYIFGEPKTILPEGRYTRLEVGAAPLYRNNRAFPRTFLVDNYRVEVGNDALNVLAKGLVDLRRTVLLEAAPPPHERPESTPSPQGPGSAVMRKYENSVVEIETQSDGPRMLVLTDVYYPGWAAFLDGRPATIYLANHAFRAVWVPGGKHIIRFEYRPLSFKIGAAISVFTLLGLLGLVLFKGRPRGPNRASFEST